MQSQTPILFVGSSDLGSESQLYSEFRDVIWIAGTVVALARQALCLASAPREEREGGYEGCDWVGKDWGLVG